MGPQQMKSRLDGKRKFSISTKQPNQLMLWNYLIQEIVTFTVSGDG